MNMIKLACPKVYLVSGASGPLKSNIDFGIDITIAKCKSSVVSRHRSGDEERVLPPSACLTNLLLESSSVVRRAMKDTAGVGIT